MNQNLEVEYKVMVSKEEYDRILKEFPGYHEITQTNHYYHGNPEGIYFRFRDLGDHYLFTHKEKAAKGKMEFEKEFRRIDLNDPELLCYLASKNILPPYTEAASLTTVRRELDLEDEANLCMDENRYGDITDYEIEYEITGEKGSLKRFKELLKKAGIRYKKSPASKQKRALEEARRTSDK
jgi:uncharacterized protein YjbK